MVGSLLWYDYETSGLDPVLDRPLQFAGLRTDLGLRPVGPMVSFSGYPGDDVVPAPEAIQVNSIDLLELRRSGLCEAEFCARVLAEFNVPDTCVVGYNSMRFDDEFTRQMCYRNFHDPYAREWSMGNSRWDVVNNVLRMARALRPDGMQWPVNAAGVSSSKLTDLTAANGIAHADAHDAAADVLATVELCRQLRSAQPQLYKFLFSQRRKNEVWAQLAPIGKHALVHCDGIYGAAQHNLGIILPLCQHPTNSNAIICYNLAAAAPDALLAADADSIAGNIFARGEARPDGPRRPAAAAYTAPAPHYGVCEPGAGTGAVDHPCARKIRRGWALTLMFASSGNCNCSALPGCNTRYRTLTPRSATNSMPIQTSSCTRGVLSPMMIAA